MAPTTVTEALQGGRATAADDSTDIDASVLDLVRRSREEVAAPRRVPLKWAVTAFAVPAAALALTGAAVTVDSTLHPDVIIPVQYVSDAGAEYRCTIYIEGGSVFDPGSTVIGDSLADRDWDGIGQRIYRLAVELSQALSSTSTMPDDERDAWAWFAAESQLTVLDLPGVDLPEGEHAVSTSTCTGDLR